MKIDAIYLARFSDEDRVAKDALWQVLCQRFLQRYVRDDDVVLDIGPGFGEFLAHIRCGRRIAADIEKLSGRQLPPGTEEVITPSHQLSQHVAASSVDVVFCSNFFEHLPDKPTFLQTLSEIRSVLRPGGRLLVLQPNIRLIGGAYWDFIDHHLPLTDRSLVEACESIGFEIVEVIPRFLPVHDAGPAAAVSLAGPAVSGASAGLVVFGGPDVAGRAKAGRRVAARGTRFAERWRFSRLTAEGEFGYTRRGEYLCQALHRLAHILASHVHHCRGPPCRSERGGRELSERVDRAGGSGQHAGQQSHQPA